jgi:hypothetical protein
MVRKSQIRDRYGAVALFSRHRAAALFFLYLLSVALSTGRAFGQGTRIGGGQMRIATNLQTGTSYTVTSSDCGKLLSLSNSSNVTVTIPAAGATGLANGCWIDIQNTGSALATFTASGSLIDGAAGFTLATNQGLRLISSGTAYFTQRGQGGGAGAGLVIENNGTPETVRPNLNLIGGNNATVVCADNSGASRTDCTVSSAGGSGSIGGTGAIQAANGTGALQATSITDNGTTVATVEPVSAGGFTSTANVQGTLSLPYSASVSGTVPNSWGWMGQNAITTPWYGCAPNASPSVNQVMLFPAPTTDSGGKAVSCWAWTGFTSTNLTDTANITYLTATQTLTGKTFDTAGSGNVLKVNGNALTGVQGNTAKVQLAGTNSGASGAGLCNDANGNTTTSGCSSGGGTAQANYSCGGVGNTMTGSDVTMCSFSGVSLAAGACLTFQGMVEAAQNYVLKINAGTTTISIPVGSNNTWGGFYVSWATMYCNNPGVQNAQTLNPLWGFYQNAYGYNNSMVPFFAEDLVTGSPFPLTPTAVNWSTAQTLSVTMNAAGGTGTVFALKVY